MLIIGVTGGFSTGKTTVAKIFGQLGAVVLDADAIVHSLIKPRKNAWKRIRDCFGEEILNKDKTINRRALAAVVFSNKRRLKKLCDIIHPLVYREIERALKKMKRKNPDAIVVLDIPLLFESGGKSMVDKSVVVKADRSAQIERASKNLGLTRMQILQRIKAQMPLREKARAADFVIDNSGTLNSTRKQAIGIWKGLVRA
ncbi:MAG: hypothetical protein AMJ78_09325 [Omnitrophica WOR_2 bacterium SM23_29]|nr:MAG: hypothetical protein AMJ78_09325 [Omnitrophica WOR_2 bacterium SM23_29]